MAGGRPTLYNPDYCQVAIDFMGQGFSQTALAGHLGIAKSTLYEWMENFPEFSDAISKAKPNRVLKLERDMLETDNAAVVNARRFALINADAQEWCDTRVNKNQHDVNAKAVVTITQQDVKI